MMAIGVAVSVPSVLCCCCSARRPKKLHTAVTTVEHCLGRASRSSPRGPPLLATMGHRLRDGFVSAWARSALTQLISILALLMIYSTVLWLLGVTVSAIAGLSGAVAAAAAGAVALIQSGAGDYSQSECCHTHPRSACAHVPCGTAVADSQQPRRR